MQGFLDRLVNFIQPLAERLGGPGLAIVAFLDSSFLSLPEVNDVLIILLAIQIPDRWLYYAAATTAGSVAGCYALYALARRGGQALLRRRVSERRLARGLDAFRRYGVLAIIVPSLLPPPMPFKMFVLLAGASGVRPLTFVLAVAAGRGCRYGSIGLLAYLYGDRATVYVHENFAMVSVWLAVGVGLAGLAWLVWRHWRRQPA